MKVSQKLRIVLHQDPSYITSGIYSPFSRFLSILALKNLSVTSLWCFLSCRCRSSDIDVSMGAGIRMIFSSLYCIQLWFSVMVAICYKLDIIRKFWSFARFPGMIFILHKWTLRPIKEPSIIANMSVTIKSLGLYYQFYQVLEM